MPDIQNSRKKPKNGKAAEKQLEKQPKDPKNSCFDCFSAVFGCFGCFFLRLFFGCFTVTHSAPFSAVFRLLGIWHFCRWPRRLQSVRVEPCVLLAFFPQFYRIFRAKAHFLGNGPNTVSGSTVSNTELNEFFGAH